MIKKYKDLKLELQNFLNTLKACIISVVIDALDVPGNIPSIRRTALLEQHIS